MSRRFSQGSGSGSGTCSLLLAWVTSASVQLGDEADKLSPAPGLSGGAVSCPRKDHY